MSTWEPLAGGFPRVRWRAWRNHVLDSVVLRMGSLAEPLCII